MSRAWDAPDETRTAWPRRTSARTSARSGGQLPAASSVASRKRRRSAAIGAATLHRHELEQAEAVAERIREHDVASARELARRVVVHARAGRARPLDRGRE